MALQDPLPDDEARLGRWPRRLLHVASMRSYPWNPGNIYNGVKEPDYTAISYTWGRWALHDDEQPGVAALNVHGTPWAIPRVNPQHFEASTFQSVLEKVATVPEVIKDDEDVTSEVIYKNVDFIWVDVACIDQRFNQESMLEIGRQACIFRNASFVYIWLSRIDTESLEDISTWIRDFAEESALNLPEKIEGYTTSLRSLEGDYDPDWFDNGVRWLRLLHEDPWFTSLWTLQEAYLCKDACFLSKEGDLSFYSTGYQPFYDEPELTQDRRIFGLGELLNATERSRVCVEMEGTATLYEENPTIERDPSFLEFLRSSGLDALSRRNPMELYTAATNRKPSRTEDSIYGIMQVFGFRLGESNPSYNKANSNKSISLADLEDELGLALMKFSPVLSQCFRHDAWPRQRGKNWRISRQSTVPGPAFTKQMPWDPRNYNTSDCEMGVRKVDDDDGGEQLWGCFAGKACPFVVLADAWSFANDSDTGMVGRWEEGESDMAIVLDRDPDLDDTFENSAEYNTRRGIMQYVVARRLREFRDDLQILHLGYCESEPNQHVHFGLLLLRDRENAGSRWRRLGVCSWQICAQRPEPHYGGSDSSDGEEVWKPGWRPVYREPYPRLFDFEGETHLDAEDGGELQAHWDNLALQSDAWERTSGIFG
ncbi:hypothetical protein DL768_008328 [Monosporascus sp. mg162]|nr:hypothetical protein DL768_008328 [Monosporascus sp. mg162]